MTLYRVAAFDSDDRRVAGGVFTSRDRALDHAATLVGKHARVVVQDDGLETVAEWVDGEEVVSPASRAGATS